MKRAILTVALTILAAPAAAQSQCVAKDTAARVLASAAPDDIHPDWGDGSTVGLAWTFETSGEVETDTGLYLQGDLYSPDGALVTEGAYVIAEEWDCGG